MIIDLGGGTADISVHQKQTNNKLKELHQASGGPWGGTVVDDNFLIWLTDIFGRQIMDTFKKKEMEDYFGLLREFEIKKRSMDPESNQVITMRLPVSLTKLHEEIAHVTLDTKIDDKGLKEFVQLRNEKMRVHPSIVRTWFDVPIINLKSHVKDVLLKENMEKVEMIFLVGGFSESKYVQKSIKDAFPRKKVIIPDDAGLVMLKGAVCFGYTPNTISSRIMPFSYGLHTSQEYDKVQHAGATVKKLGGVKKAADLFDVIIHAGTRVEIGKTIRKGPYKPNNPVKTVLDIYRTKEENPKYINDPGCIRVGRLNISHPGGKSLDDNTLSVDFTFGDAELVVTAENIKKKKLYSTCIDYVG
ncbi:heat shock 70 kDa protein 12A-like [Mercenaria mercenaria]|uniref:heat shock 70 kDa protein 12A-like n=1 Tax=Mercenaria mercenaria TaxID=6596 RepID=UPI00234F53C4|nr:heat shock 70 kDa protein 12A-like [Mercenaria mercenaria]